MSEQNPQPARPPVQPLDNRASPDAAPVPDWMPRGAEWIWWSVLVVSILVGFGMTIFAPT